MPGEPSPSIRTSAPRPLRRGAFGAWTTLHRLVLAALALPLLASGCARGSGGVAGPASDTAAPALRLEEICPVNITLRDERGEDPGWIEIANRSSDPIDLGGWRLRGRAKDGPGWRLPERMLEPGERLVVFMSGLDIRSPLPPGDTLSVFNPTEVGAWSDSANDPPGASTWSPWEFAELVGALEDGSPAVSARLVLADNAKIRMKWSASLVEMPMPGGRIDASGRDHLHVRATIPEGQSLVVKFCQEGVECYYAGYVSLRGTGKPLDAYDIPLHSSHADLSLLKSIVFEPPAHVFGTYLFTVSETFFHRAGRRPHASFTLARLGGELVLEDTSGRVAGRVVYPELPAGASWARDPISGTWRMREAPTPGGDNPAESSPPQLPAPAFVTPPGFHAAPLLVRVQRPPGTVVRCECGGGAPGEESPALDSGVHLDSSDVVRCAAFGPGGARSPATTGTFLLGENIRLPVVAIAADPVSLLHPDSGLYSKGPNASPGSPYYGANFWKDIELPAFVEFFEGGRRAFALPAGLSIHGVFSRSYRKKSLAVEFRERYGARHLEWPLFASHPRQNRFKGFILRNNGTNFGKDHFLDAFLTSLTEGRGLEYQRSRHVVVFLNGRYWGIHDLREKLDAEYLRSRFGLDPAQVDMLENWGWAQVGSGAGWIALRAQLEDADLSDSAQFASIASRLDVDNYADYIGAELYFANGDWPANNQRSWRVASPAGRWRMILFDTDGGFDIRRLQFDMFPFATNTSTEIIDWPNGPQHTLVFRRLLANPRWRDRFATRLSVQLSTNFAPERVERTLDSLLAHLAPDQPRDCERWELALDSIVSRQEEIRTFARERASIVRRQMREFLGLLEEVPVALSAEGGVVLIEGVPVGASYRGIHPGGLAMEVQAVSAAGRTFAGWSDGNDSLVRMITPGPAGIEVLARFR